MGAADRDRLQPEEAEPVIRPLHELAAEPEPAPADARRPDDEQTGEGEGGWVPL